MFPKIDENCSCSKDGNHNFKRIPLGDVYGVDNNNERLIYDWEKNYLLGCKNCTYAKRP